MIRVATDASETIISIIMMSNILVTGLNNVFLTISRKSDDYIYDFSDNIFKSSGWISKNIIMEEIDSINLPGQYKYEFDTALIINPIVDDCYICVATCDSADNTPQTGELKTGESEDRIKEILGLVQSNILITPTNDANGNMTSATIKIYPTKADKIADTNVLHVYTATATYDGDGYCTSYSCVKDS